MVNERALESVWSDFGVKDLKVSNGSNGSRDTPRGSSKE
jgi:hypothetical protein